MDQSSTAAGEMDISKIYIIQMEFNGESILFGLLVLVHHKPSQAAVPSFDSGSSDKPT